MELYKKLTQFIKSAQEIKNLEKQKSSEKEKEKKFKEFTKNLKSILSIKNLTKEGIIFRKYWIQIPFLAKLIEKSFQYRSNSENDEIKNLLDKAKKNGIINKNKNKKEQDINEIVEEKKQIKNKDEQIKNKNESNFDLNLNKINVHKVVNFYPKDYVIKKNNENKKTIKEKKKEEKKDNYKFYLNESDNILDEYNLKNNDKFPNFDNDKKNNRIINNINNSKKENFIINKNGNKNDKNLNIDIEINKSKENDIKANNNTIEDILKLKYELNNNNQINVNNNNFNNNIIIQKEKKEQEKINNNNNIIKEEENKELNIKKDNNYSKPISQKQENELIKIEEFCDELLNNSKKNNIIQIIFDSYFNNNNNNDKIKNINYICSKIFGFVNRFNNQEIKLRQNLKEKLITLICILYPFSKGKKSEIQKDIFKSESSSDKNLYEFLSNSIIIKPIEGFKFSEFNDNQIIGKFCHDLKLNMKFGKYEIYNAFIFLVILRNLRKYDKNGYYKEYFKKILEKEFMISYKLNFILRHIEFYDSCINRDDGSNFPIIYNGLYFIKIFYDEIFSEIKLIHMGNDNYIFNGVELSLNKECDYDIKKLFQEKDEIIYNNVMKKIEYFYHIDKFYFSIDIYNLINYSNNKFQSPEYNFIFNLVQLETIKLDYIYNNFAQYKNNLLSLENDIYNIGKENLNLPNNMKIIAQYSINQAKKQVFESLLLNIKRNISKDKDILKWFELYPYGSVTEFLGSKDSDIDIYLNITTNDNEIKLKILKSLCGAIKDITGISPEQIISARLCVIKFKYGSNKTDFDISLMGFCPYLHSILIRTYSLIDPRFTLLALALKKFISIIKIKNEDNNQSYLNTFCWMILLITFLQDVIKPPILPKLLSDKNNSINNKPIQFGKNYKSEKNRFNKCFEKFIKNIRVENIQLPDFLFNKNLLYEKFRYFKAGENNLSCAEIFLSFLEYIIYYFKYDAVYVNCSIEYEGYEPLKNIMDYQDSKEKHRKDDIFYEYFKNIYLKKRHHENSNRIKDGLILIRDPFDPHYNPAQNLRKENFGNFLDSLKFGYLSLIKHGKFEKLKKEVEEKENKNKNNYKIY